MALRSQLQTATLKIAHTEENERRLAEAALAATDAAENFRWDYVNLMAIFTNGTAQYA